MILARLDEKHGEIVNEKSKQFCINGSVFANNLKWQNVRTDWMKYQRSSKHNSHLNTHTHTDTQTHTDTHTHTNKHSLSLSFSRSQTHTSQPLHTHKNTTHSHTHPQHTHTCTTYTHMHNIHTHLRHTLSLSLFYWKCEEFVGLVLILVKKQWPFCCINKCFFGCDLNSAFSTMFKRSSDHDSLSVACSCKAPCHDTS